VRRFAFVIASVVFMASGSAQGSDTRDLPAVEIDGQTLTFRDVERQLPGALFKAYNGFHDAQRKAIDRFVDEYLLEREARRENITVAELLERHVNRTIAKDPSDEALRVFYEGMDTAESFETARVRILEHLRQRRIAKAKTEYLASLRAHAKIGIKLAPPRIQVPLKDTPLRGPSDAPVVLVEYADYECPYCQQIQPALDRLQAEYRDRMAFAYKDMPLPMHPRAQKAAEATHCAAAQGKYWEYHDVIATSKKLDLTSLREQARDLKLDGKAFDACLDGGEASGIVNGHLMEAQTLGLDGTPSFFVNGRFFSGVMSYEQLRAIVEEELATQASVAREVPRH
jgi:protein-disulfide isomerase